MDVAKRAPVVQKAPDSPSEHIYIGSEDLNPDPEQASRTIREHVELRNALQRTSTDLTLYDEGFLKVVATVKGQRGVPFRLDLHYLDPVPAISRVVAKRAMYAAFGCTAAAGVGALLTLVQVLQPFAAPMFFACVAAALAALLIAVFRSHERIEFVTIHGRAPVLCLIAHLGSIKRFRAFIPALSRAIEESAERIVDDTSAYLRAEMREHYRLRGDGVLSNESCAECTGRILAQFDIQL